MRVLLYSFIAALAILATAYGSRSKLSPVKASDPVDVRLAGEGAYRDGLYLGRLDRQRRAAEHPAWARWNAEEDRKLFVRGYEMGYRSEKTPRL